MAKGSNNSQGRANSRSRKADLRAQAVRRKRNRNLMLIGGLASVTVIVVGLLASGLVNSRPVAGEQRLTSQGNTHIDFGSVSPLPYNSAPPTSGPHYPNLAAWGEHSEPVRYEHLVHNLEDGGVIVYYQCGDGCPELVAGLREILESYFGAGANVVLAPNDPTWTIGNSLPLHKDMGARIALTSWQRLLTMDAVDEATIRAFIEQYEGLDHHARS